MHASISGCHSSEVGSVEVYNNKFYNRQLKFTRHKRVVDEKGGFYPKILAVCSQDKYI
jgi:hypothetical protein